jgi:hypothetical protein
LVLLLCSLQAFTGVEFILPFEASTDASERRRQMCVLCHRKLVQSLFYDIMYAGAPFSGVIQRYGNICNHAGKKHGQEDASFLSGFDPIFV